MKRFYRCILFVTCLFSSGFTLAQLPPSGFGLRWFENISSPSGSIELYGLSLSQGNPVLGGAALGQLTFNPVSASSTILNLPGNLDAFTGVYQPNGTFLASQYFSVNNTNEADRALAIKGSNSLNRVYYAISSQAATITADNGGARVIVADRQGNFIRQSSLIFSGSSSTAFARIYDLALADISGEEVAWAVAGDMVGAATNNTNGFGAFNVVHQHDAGGDYFDANYGLVYRINTDGTNGWGNFIRRSANTGSGEERLARPKKVDFNTFNNYVYAVGQHKGLGTTTFDNERSFASARTLAVDQEESVFMVAYNNANGVIVVNPVNLASSDEAIVVEDMVTDPVSGSIIISGKTQGNSSFDLVGGTANITGSKGFIASYSASGSFEWLIEDETNTKVLQGLLQAKGVFMQWVMLPLMMLLSRVYRYQMELFYGKHPSRLNQYLIFQLLSMLN